MLSYIGTRPALTHLVDLIWRFSPRPPLQAAQTFESPMQDPMVTTILSALESVRGDYYRLVFVGPVAEPYLLAISRTTRFPLINLSLEMSRLLIDVPPARRARDLPGIAESLLDHVNAEGVILNRLELLFLPSLSHDPVRTLLRLSRNLTILAVLSLIHI